MDIRTKEIQRLKEIKAKKELTREDLEFLYNIHYHITDNDVYNEARRMVLERNKLEDLAYIFDCSTDKIGFNEAELKEGKELVYFESLYSLQHVKIKGYEEFDRITFPEYFNGSIDVIGIEEMNYKQFPKTIKGEINMKDTKHMENTILPEKITYSLKLRNLETCKNVIFPRNIYGALIIGKLKELNGIIVPVDFKYNSISGNFKEEDFKAKCKKRF